MLVKMASISYLMFMTSELITIPFFFALPFSSFNADFLIVFFERCKIFTRFAELALFHTFTNIPMHKCTFGIHQIKFVIDARENLSNRRRVTDHAHCARYFCQIASWDHRWWLV